MAKQRITRQEAFGNKATLKVGYCDLQYLLRHQTAFGYNAGVYGWNFDHYYIDGIAINTGYRSMVGKQVDYKLTNEYNEKARKIQENWNLTYNQQKAYTERLLKNFLKKAVKI